MWIDKIAKQFQTFMFSSCTKALYTVVFLLMQQIQKPLTLTGAKGISITFCFFFSSKKLLVTYIYT